MTFDKDMLTNAIKFCKHRRIKLMNRAYVSVKLFHLQPSKKVIMRLSDI